MTANEIPLIYRDVEMVFNEFQTVGTEEDVQTKIEYFVKAGRFTQT